MSEFQEAIRRILDKLVVEVEVEEEAVRKFLETAGCDRSRFHCSNGVDPMC